MKGATLTRQRGQWPIEGWLGGWRGFIGPNEKQQKLRKDFCVCVLSENFLFLFISRIMTV